MTGARCSVCAFPQRVDVDRRLIHRESMRAIAAATGLSLASIQRHSKHVPQLVADPVARAAGMIAVARGRMAPALEAAIDALESSALAQDLVALRDFARRTAEECVAKERYRDAAEHADRWFKAAQYLHSCALAVEKTLPSEVPDDEVTRILAAVPADLREQVAAALQAQAS